VRGSAGWPAAIAAIAIVAQGCTTLLYKGPTRPSSEVAVVTSTQTIVDEVDDVRVRDHASGSSARLELLPGPHRLGITVYRVTSGLFVTSARSDTIVACVELAAGHTYQTRPAVSGYRIGAQVVDLTNGLYASRCQRSRPIAPIVRAAPPPSPPQPIGSQPGSLGAGATMETSADAATAPQVNALAASPPATANATQETPAPAPRAAAGDIEEPPSSVRPVLGRAQVRERLPSDAELARRPPGTGLSLMLGGAFGGEEFVKASNGNGDQQGLSSGGGVLIGIGGMLTPVWAADTVGFGLGVDGAVKYDHLSASNGSASITRFPLALTAHILLNVSDDLHYIIFKGGVARDFGVNYSASGFASLDVNVSGTWGPTGALGYYKRSNDVFGWDILAFFALTNHVVGTEKINANSFGVSTALHWRP